MRKKSNTALMLAACVFSAAMIPGAVQAKEEKLKVGVRDDIMHMSCLNLTTGKYYGMEVDLAAELAKDLGYGGAEYITVTPENRKEMLLNGEIDCLIACYSVEETRLENFDFSPVYYTTHSMIMVEKSSKIENIEEIVGTKIGVLDGANTAPKLSEYLIEKGLLTETDARETSLEKKASYGELSLALEQGDVDAVCMDGCFVRTYMEDDRVLLDEKIGKEEYAVATQKDSELSEKMAASVQKLLDDGTVGQLIEKWK